ncbi:hypothetical protein [Burkholderia sp. SIMBA_062]|uniref:hypothetical protein n=1 Tax=Burkholderia sp. SIMBA_062 TaxID=3085803 RepID=UPI00397E7BB3
MNAFFPPGDIDRKPLPPSKAERISSRLIGVSLMPALGVLFVAAAVSGCGESSGDPFSKAGLQVQQSTKDAVTYMGSKETVAGTYVLQFRTRSNNLMASPNGNTDRAAYLKNQGRALLWKQAACTDEVSAVSNRLDANMVTAQLVSESGELQFVAVCH